MFQPKCSSQIKKMEYYLAINKNEIMPFAATGMNLEIILLNEERENKIFYHNTLIKDDLRCQVSEEVGD